MRAYKVGKIAQNRVSFLSNHLADEAWVRDREWAIAINKKTALYLDKWDGIRHDGGLTYTSFYSRSRHP